MVFPVIFYGRHKPRVSAQKKTASAFHAAADVWTQYAHSPVIRIAAASFPPYPAGVSSHSTPYPTKLQAFRVLDFPHSWS